MSPIHERATADLVRALRVVRLSSYQAELEQTMLDAVAYAARNEWGLGLEILCSNLYEYEFPLPRAAFDQIVISGNAWGVDQHLIAVLRERIVDP